MTSKAKILTNILPRFPTHLTPYCLKYFLGLLCTLIYAYLPSQSSPLMFTMYYHLLILINRKVLIMPNRLKNCAQSFATPFSLLINFIVATSHFPTAWKIASVIPLHKSGSLHDVRNNRPISVLPSLSKIFEKLIHKHLHSYFEANNLLYNRNSGFRKYYSTKSILLKVTHKLLVAKDSGCSS